MFNHDVRLSLAGIVLAFAIALNPTPVVGQAVSNAQLSGVISDPSGLSIPGATVKVTQTETGFSRTTTTNASGTYVVPSLPVGPYTVEVTSDGFSSYVQRGIVLTVGANTTVNVALQVGSVSQQIEVVAGAAMVESHDTSVSETIDQQRLIEMPLNGRQATSLILLSGGSAPAPHFVGSKTYGAGEIQGSASISVAGGQGNWTNYLMDGGDNNHPYANVNLPFPFPDAIQEFSVQTSGLPARYGLHPGGVVNVVTKSGTNGFHGNLFEFVRNGNLNARNYFAKEHDSLKRNQFGGTIGGPVLKDQLFFFFGYQGTRVRTAPPQTISFIPTAAAASGDFSQLVSGACQSSGKPRKIVNPDTGEPFPNSFVNPAMFSPQAVALLDYLPETSDPCGRTVYGIASPQGENQYLGRVDWNPGSKHTVFGRYFFADLNNPPPAFENNVLNTTRAGLNDKSRSLVLGENFTISPTTLNSARVSFTRMAVNRGPTDDNINPADVGINVYSPVPNYLAIGVSGFFGIGCGSCSPAEYTTQTLQFADDLDVIRGRHHLSFGGNYIHNNLDYANVYLNNGTWSFNGQGSGDALVDFMLGHASSFTQGNTAATNQRQNYVGLYAQDNIQFGSLDLHFGLRWEPFLPAVDQYDRVNHFDPEAFAAGQRSQVYTNAPPGVFFVGDPGVGRRFGEVKYGNLAPRIGFVWDPTGSGRQSIRSSYSIFYDQPMLNYGTHPGQGPPWGNSVTLPSPAGGLGDPFAGYSGGNPFPTPFPPPSDQVFPLNGSYTNIQPDIRSTYMQQWNLSYQRQVGEWLLAATYLGNKTTHLWSSTEQNPAVFIPGTCGSGPCSTRQNTTQRRVLYLQDPSTGEYYSNIANSDDGANSSYNAVLFSVRRRMSRNYTLLTNYTYSHCIGDGPFTGELGGPNYQNPYYRGGDRGNCEFDLRHAFNLSMVALAPHFDGPVKNAILGGWQIAPLLSLRSGTWFSPATGIDNSLTGVGKDRPDVVGNPYVRDLDTRQWLTAAAFTPNAIGTFGDAGAFSLVGPSYLGFDLGITRQIKVRESQQVQLRFEVFNLLNKTNFASPVSNLNSSNFGKIQSASDPRILQLALKYSF